MLDKNNGLPYKYQSKTGYDTLIQNVILKELINILGATIVDKEMESKLSISRIENLESRHKKILFINENNRRTFKFLE